jgi:hypothetical protein
MWRRPDEANRETVIWNFLTGQYSNALRAVAFNTAEGRSRDVPEDIAGEVLEVWPSPSAIKFEGPSQR